MTSLPSIAELEGLALSQLKGLYQVLINEALPARASRQFLIGNLAWAIQAEQAGKNPSALREKLLDASGRQVASQKAHYMPGTRLIREWHGVTHEVIVEEKGFRWQQRVYGNLSQIAREITGARWSGPRFFGIKTCSATGKSSVGERP